MEKTDQATMKDPVAASSISRTLKLSSAKTDSAQLQRAQPRTRSKSYKEANFILCEKPNHGGDLRGESHLLSGAASDFGKNSG